MPLTLRRRLMAERDAALAAGNHARFQELTTELSNLPLNGVPELTPKDIARWNKSHASRAKLRKVSTNAS